MVSIGEIDKQIWKQ